MALLSDMEFIQMAKSELAVTPNPACRIIELIPLSEQEKYKGSKSDVNDALKALRQFCKVAKRPGNIKYQGPSTMKYVKVLRDAGLGKYFYRRDAIQAKNAENKAAAEVAAAAQVAQSISEPAVVEAVNNAAQAVITLTRNTSASQPTLQTNTKVANASEEAKIAVNKAITITNIKTNTKTNSNTNSNISEKISEKISELNTKLKRVLKILEEEIQPSAPASLSAPAAGGRRKTRKYKLSKRKHTRKHI